MKRFRLLVLAFSCLISVVGTAQTLYELDPQVPSQPLDAKSKLTVLGSRLGSRLSLSLVTKEAGLHAGVMGYDNDQLRALLVQLKSETGKNLALRTGHLTDGAEYLPNQQIRLGMATYQVAGESNDVSLKLTVVSPFTPSTTLDDEAAVKLAIAPLHYLIVEAENKSAKPASYELQVGLQGIPFDRDKEVALSWWRRGTKFNDLFFKDVAGSSSLTALSAVNFEGQHFENAGYQGLGSALSLQPKEKLVRIYAFTGHHQEKVMNHLPTSQSLKFYYNRYWKDIAEVITFAKQNMQVNLDKTAAFEQLITKSSASAEEKWVAALTFRTDLANTFLVIGDKDNKERFYLTEGRFRHMNTIDVAHETEIMSLFTPWRLKLQLEQWTDYLATKEVKVPSGRRLGTVNMNTEGVSATEFGPFLYHDVGNFPYVYAAEGYDFGPVMPVEENTCFALLLHFYWKTTGDDAFVKRHLGLTAMLMESLINRDSNGNGIADYAFGWSSYDVSEAIKRSPDNVYLGVKQLLAYEVVAEMLQALPHVATRAKTTPLKSTDEDGTTLDGNGKAEFEKSIMDNRYLRARQAKNLQAEAERIAQTIRKTFKTYGYLPTSIDKNFDGWAQHSIVIAEGLFLPGLAGLKSKRIESLLPLFSANYNLALKRSTTKYGIKLSDEEPPTWFSKAMVADVVSSYWFGKPTSSATYTYKWNANNHQAYQDGAFSEEKEWPGNWYPRGVSSIPYLFRAQKLQGPALMKWAQLK